MQLIGFIQAEQIIYDRGLPSHHNADMVAAAWVQISQAIGVDDSKWIVFTLVK